MEDDGEGGEGPHPLVAMVMDVCACDQQKATRALAMAGHDPNTAIELVLSGHPRLVDADRELSPPRLPGGGSMVGGDGGGGGSGNSGDDEDVAEMIQWGLSESAAKYALLRNNFNRQQAVEWWFTVPEGEQLRLNSTDVPGDWEMYRLAHRAQMQSCRDPGAVEQLLSLLGGESTELLDEMIMKALTGKGRRSLNELKTMLKCGVLDRMAQIVHDHFTSTEKPDSPAAGSLVRQAFSLMQGLCRQSRDVIVGGSRTERAVGGGPAGGFGRSRGERADAESVDELRRALSSGTVQASVLSVLFDSGKRNIDSKDQRGILQLVTWLGSALAGSPDLLLQFVFAKPHRERRSLFGVLVRQSQDLWQRGGNGGDESRAEYQQYVIAIVLMLDCLNKVIVNASPGAVQGGLRDELNTQVAAYAWKLAGVAQILSDCRSDAEDVLALRLADAMLACHPQSCNALLRHGLLRAVQELTPPINDITSESDEDESQRAMERDAPGTADGDAGGNDVGASVGTLEYDGQDGRQGGAEQPDDAPAAEEMDSPPSPGPSGEAGWVVNCVANESSAPVMPFRQSCVFDFEAAAADAAGRLEAGLAVVAPHPAYDSDKLWSAQVIEGDDTHQEDGLVVLRYADSDVATQPISEICTLVPGPRADPPAVGTEVLVLFRQYNRNGEGPFPEYRKMCVTDQLPETGLDLHDRMPQGFAEGLPGEEQEEETGGFDEEDREEMDEFLYAQEAMEERLRESGLEPAFFDAVGGSLGGIAEILGHLQGDQDAEYDLRDMLERDLQFGTVGSIANMARRVLSSLQAAELPSSDVVTAIAGLRTNDEDAITNFGKMLWHSDSEGMTAYEFEEAHCGSALLELTEDQLHEVFAKRRELVNFAASLQADAEESQNQELLTLIEQSLQVANRPLSDEAIDAQISELERAAGRRYKSLGFINLLSRLHDVVASTDMLPVWHFHRESISWTSFAGRSFYGKPISVCFTQAEDSARFNSNLPLKQYLVDGILSAAELEKLLLQNIRCTDPRFLSFCHDLIGCTVEVMSSSSSRWRRAEVESFDAETGRHVFRYSSGQQVSVLLSSGDVEYRIIERQQLEPAPEMAPALQSTPEDDLPDGATLNITVVRNDEARAGYTVHRSELIVAEAEPGSVAYENGIRAGYRITHVDGEEVNTWSDYLRLARPRAEFVVTVEVQPDMDRSDLEMWFWQEDDRHRHNPGGGWKRFDERSQGVLDAAFDMDPEGEVRLEGLPNGSSIVDFVRMLLVNEDTGHRNVVRRCNPTELEPSRGAVRRGNRRSLSECWYRTWDGFDLQSSEEKAREYSRGGRLVETQETAMVKTLSARQQAERTTSEPLARPELQVELTFGGFGVEKDSQKPRRARATNDFLAQPDMDGYYRPLEFKEGDVIEVTSKEPGGGWWTGRLDGKRGLIPADFVRLLEDEDPQQREQVGIIPASTVINPGDSLLSVLMRGTEVDHTGDLAGIWRVEMSDSGGDPEELLWFIAGVGGANEYVGAKLDGGKLTALIEGRLLDNGTFTFTQSGRSGVLNRLPQGSALTGTIGTDADGNKQMIRAARVGDSTSQTAVPFGAVCNIQYRIRVIPPKSVGNLPPSESHTEPETAIEPEPDYGVKPAVVAQRARITASTTFAAALKLLGRLHKRCTDWQRALGVDKYAFENPAMSRKLEEQLFDPVAVAAGSLPGWCTQWIEQGSFLFARSLRERFLHATAFGPTRALVHMHSVTNGSDGGNRRFSGGRLGQMPELKPDKWIVRRDPLSHFLVDVDAVLAQRAAAVFHRSRRAARTRLEVNIEFRVGGVEQGEAFTGAGLGVHVQFYTEVARALESVEEQANVRAWMGEAGSGAAAGGTTPLVQDLVHVDWLPAIEESLVAAVSAIRQDARIPAAEQQRYIAAWRMLRDGGGAAVEPSLDGGLAGPDNDSVPADAASGEYTPLQCSLYPRALLRHDSDDEIEKVCSRFRLLGRCMATALLERQLLPIQLHKHFINLALHRIPTMAAEDDDDVAADWLVVLRELSAEGEVRGAALVAWVLQALDTAGTGGDEWPSFLADVYFTDPAHPVADAADEATRTAAALIDGGERKLLTRENACEYLRAVHNAWCNEGVVRQVAAFRMGFGDIVPAGIDATFSSFTAEEVTDMICGSAINWDEATLRACIVPAAAPPTYEVGEDHMEWLIAVLLEMGPQARSMFLNFVTARRRLPGGDLRNLPVLPGSGATAGGSSPLRRVSMGGRTNKLSGRITVDASSGAAPLMKGSTCSYRLHMPRVYGNSDELRDHLYRSMAWSSGMHD